MKKTQRINIYLTMKDKKKLDGLKYKYHLSYSTIVNIICEYIEPFLNIKLDQEIYKDTETKKTSIKPKYNWQPKHAERCLKIFLRNDLKQYLPESEKFYNNIYNKFENTYEENWEGNKWHRLLPRMIKQNKEYYRRILEE